MPYKILLRLFPVLLLALAAATFSLYQIRTMSTSEAAGSTYAAINTMPEPEPVQAFSFIDDQGVPFSNEQLEDQWSLLFFGFTHCPDICPTTMATLRGFVDRLADTDVVPQVVLVSVDPERDSPDVLHSYVQQFHPEFRGIVGSKADMVTLSKSFGLFVATSMPSRSEINGHSEGEDEERHGMMHANPHAGHGASETDYTINHSGYVLIINPNGQYVGRFSPPFTVEEMAESWRDFVEAG